MSTPRFSALLGIAAIFVAAGVGSAAAPPVGALTQLPGGCLNEPTDVTCLSARGLSGPDGVAVSPDGRNVYTAAFEGNAIAVFARDARTGELAQAGDASGCVSEPEASPGCAEGFALQGATSAALTPDGRNLYVASFYSAAVTGFSRDPGSGRLTQLAGPGGCVSGGITEALCGDGRGLFRTADVGVSPDGRNVYAVGNASNAVVILSRSEDGTLTQSAGPEGCVEEPDLRGVSTEGCNLGRALEGPTGLVISPDGRNVYVSTFESRGLAVFARNAADGLLTQLPGTDGCITFAGEDGCAQGTAIDGPFGVAISPDGRSVYVTSGFSVDDTAFSNAIAVFARDSASGRLTQLPGQSGCISDSGSEGACAMGRGLVGARGVTVSPDGRNVYVASNISEAIAIFSRSASGALTQLPAGAGCVSDSGSGGACGQGTALKGATGVVVAPDGRNLYAAAFFSDAVVSFARAGPVLKLSAPLSGSLAGLRGDRDGSGSAVLTVSSSEVCWTIAVKRIARPQASHLHRGLTGPVIARLAPPSKGCVAVAASLATQLSNSPGSFYVDVHNSAYPRGALRGRLRPS